MFFHILGYLTTIVIDRTSKNRYYSLGVIDEDAVLADFKKRMIPVIDQYLSKEKK